MFDALWTRLKTGMLGAGLCLAAGPAMTQGTEPPAAPAQKTPPWAYPLLGPGVPTPANDGIKHALPGSAYSFTLTELFDQFNACDWFPDSHPPMPDVVKHGRKPEVRACGMCHFPNGQGRPENASLAGLPADYIVQQVLDYKAGLRRSSEPQSGPNIRMLSTAQAVSEEDVKIAAQYFASLAYQPWIRVVETETVPQTRVVIGSMWAALEGGAPEPIGRRIVEIPADLERTELRDPRSGFVAYVPPGSIRQGEILATTGGGKTTACIACHGKDLKGAGPIPPLAGRSAQYIVRQLYDFQHGTRTGPRAQPMQEVTARLSLDDMIAAAAYAASRQP